MNPSGVATSVKGEGLFTMLYSKLDTVEDGPRYALLLYSKLNTMEDGPRYALLLLFSNYVDETYLVI